MVVLYLGLTGGYEILERRRRYYRRWVLQYIHALVHHPRGPGRRLGSTSLVRLGPYHALRHADRKLLLDSEPVSFVVALVIGATDAVIDYFVPDD